ncbi:DNA-directed RNA polymerase subunit delta [Paenibacillus ginsengarvi]|uniref:Probable DNA-directed RNA polymerase subunit delta n=1 Tax=Paenibacillus ginsengarvi TaxID=400777 RepID=A0A3B0CQK5_9BACL|nr:DNA-directed RNA polymerase subunit delta [Paenibacillus ginsengarvi]RKN85726.1 DNA-directed RNA polymerase subunit delta [Paenibacillus ginsengarvi]
MSSPYTLKIDAEQAKEMPMVDLAFEVLKASKNPFYYRDLMQEIAKIKGLSDDDVMQVIAQLYTEINIDGRFACVGTNLWGLKRWYPVEKSEDAAVGASKHPRIINDDDDDDDYYPEDEESEEEYESYEGEGEFSGEEEDFYQDEEAIDDTEIEEVEGEIAEIDEESEEEEEDFDGEAADEAGEEEEDDDEDDK